jgi:putative peptidoglycan lipid II flippase
MTTSRSNTSAALGKAASVAVLIMAVSNILSRLLGWGRIKALAHLAGISGDVDAYIFAFTIPDLINHFLAGSALSITFIPMFQRYLSSNDERGGWRFFSNVMCVGTLFFIVAIALSMLFTGEILSLAGKNINNPDNSGQLLLTLKLTRIILPAQIFFFWGALLNGAQYAKKKFLLPALTPVMYNLGIICGGLLLYDRIGVAGFSWGVLIGAFVGNVAIQIPGALKAGMKISPRFDLRDPDLIRFALITVPLIIGLSMTFSNEFFPKYFASFVPHGEGSIAGLDYSYKIISMLFGLFGQSVIAGIYPFLSQYAVEKNMDALHKTISSVLTKITALLLPVTGIFMVLADDIIAVLLQGGAFNRSDTAQTARTFAGFVLSAFFMAGANLYTRAFYALQRTFLPMLVSTCVIAACLPFYYWAAVTVGAWGIARSATAAMALLFIVMACVWNKQLPNTYVFQNVKNVLVVAALTGIGSFCGFALKKAILTVSWFTDMTAAKHAVIGFIIGVPCLALILAGIELLGIQNMRRTVGAVFTKRKRGDSSSGGAPA